MKIFYSYKGIRVMNYDHRVKINIERRFSPFHARNDDRLAWGRKLLEAAKIFNQI